MKNGLFAGTAGKTIIPAVRKPEDLAAACRSEWPILFLLTGNLFTVEDYVREANESGKKVFLHVDFLAGLGTDPVAVEYIADRVRPAGIISTKSHMVKQAKKCGLQAIQRLFLIDTSALEHGIHTVRQNRPDALEVMPGLIPRVIGELSASTSLPIIAGGLIKDHAEIEMALQAGAAAVSMGNKSLWHSFAKA